MPKHRSPETRSPLLVTLTMALTCLWVLAAIATVGVVRGEPTPAAALTHAQLPTTQPAPTTPHTETPVQAAEPAATITPALPKPAAKGNSHAHMKGSVHVHHAKVKHAKHRAKGGHGKHRGHHRHAHRHGKGHGYGWGHCHR